MQINRSPKREFTKEGKKKEDAHWKKKSSKRVAYEKIERLKEEKEKFFTKKNKIKESKTISIPKSIEIMETITVSDLAKKLNVKAGEIIAKLISMGVMATINQVIDSDTANIVAIEYNCETKVVSLYDETIIEEAADSQGDLVFRPPIVTVMGHVDHGKTRLLDAIRETDVVASEAGGITQHIGAYQINIKSGSIVFLDTPGHEAFTAMRARGAKVTDIVVLVVAGDDGVMPQTIEAINHAREAEVPIVVAINKIDSPKVNLDRVKQQLADLDLLPEEWGGKTMIVEVSALKKMNLDKLLDAILLEAEMLELRANPNRKAYGTIIESRIDIGRGSVATVLIQNGTLKIGDSFVSGVYSGKVRALFNDKGQPVNMALPSTPVEVLGLDGVPNAGDPFNVIEEEKIAKQIAQKRQELKRINNAKNVKKITLDDLSRQIKEGEIKDLKIVLKGDVQGSIEALKDAFHKLSNSEINVKVIHSSTGAINENDVMLASASNAIIVGFHVHPNSKAFNLAHRENVEIRKHSIIYDAIDSIKNAMEGMLSPELREEITGQAEVRELYKVPKVGVIAGCYVQSGKILKNSRLRIIREGIEVYEGDVLALKRFKDDVTEVKEKFECGISIHNYQDIKVGDIIEGFIIKEFAKTLS
ncbi:MAG: translation initiation factor IF-2 [Spirochaetota bacterium]|nr:translation initiation factor IF-2 [Spirochaetota bacterium]